MDWKESLNNMLRESRSEKQATQTSARSHQQQINGFFSLVTEAFEEIKVEIEKNGRRVVINIGKYACAMDIYTGSRMEFTYAVKVCKYVPTATGDYSFYNANGFDQKNGVQRYKFASIGKTDKQRIISDFVRSYKKQLKTLATEK